MEDEEKGKDKVRRRRRGGDGRGWIAALAKLRSYYNKYLYAHKRFTCCKVSVQQMFFKTVK